MVDQNKLILLKSSLSFFIKREHSSSYQYFFVACQQGVTKYYIVFKIKTCDKYI